MAMGTNVTVVNASKKTTALGTSFSCPIICGLTASLWQVLPHLNSLELISLIRRTADRYQTPNIEYGYGIADFFKAYNEGKTGISIPVGNSPEVLIFSANENKLYISNKENSPTRLFIYTSMGVKVLERHVSSADIDVRFLNKGIYIALLQQGNKQYVRKFIK
jgi:hypothetical protein